MSATKNNFVPEPIANTTTPTNFFSSGLRQKIDQLMDILWAGGVNNPMDSIEQISYLLFIKMFSERDELLTHINKAKHKSIFVGEFSRCRWGNFVTLTGDELFAAVRAAIERLHELPGLSQTGKLLFERSNLKIFDRPTLRAVIQAIHEMDLTAHDGIDLKGDMYEYLLGKLAASGTNGQFRTPRHIIDMIVAMVDPQPHHRIADPAVGTAGFLISALNHILRQHTKPTTAARGVFDGDQLKPKQWEFLEKHAFTGFDNDANMVKIAIMNLYLHNLEQAHIEHFNPLTTSRAGGYPGQLFDCVLANPPFSGAIQKESILADINLPTRDTEKLFLKWFMDHLATDGKCGIIIPSGVLFGGDKASVRLRELLIEKMDLQAVVTLPAGVFKPYASVSTAVLVFQNREKTDFVWFYELAADGFSLTDTRTPILDNDIPDLLSRWPTRADGGKGIRVPASEIAARGYELRPVTYRTHTLVVRDHGSPDQIIDKVLATEIDIQDRLKSLKGKMVW
jgi:type I restriction enzyme M protein